MVDGQNQNQDQRYTLSDYFRAAVDGLFDGDSSEQSKVYAVYNDLHTVRQLSRKSRGAYFAPALLTQKEHAQLVKIAEDASTIPSSAQSMANQSASAQTQDSDQQLCWSAHLRAYQKLFALRAADDVPLDDVQAREVFVDKLLDTGFRQENVATQEALLQAPQLDQLQRFHFFMTLSPDRKYALLESNKLSLDDLVFFQEKMKAQLENSQHAGNVVYAAFAFLALMSTVVVGALLLAGPLGMAVSIGSVSLGVVFLQFLVKKAVNFVLDFRYAFYYGNKVNSTELSEEEKEYVRSRYQHFSKRRLLNLISIAVVVILFVGCMFFPPAMTPVLVVGFIFMAHAFGKHCEGQAQGLVSKWIRIPCILFARLLQMPLVLPRSGIRLLVYLGEKSEQGSQLYLRGQFLGLLRLPLWLWARFLQLPKTLSQGVSSSFGLLLPENVRGDAFDEIRGTLRGKYEKKAKSFLYVEVGRITQFSQLGSALTFVMDVGKQLDMVRDFFRMKREKIFCDYLAGYVAMKQQVDAVVSQGPDYDAPDDSQSSHTMDSSALVRQITPTLPKNLSLLPAKNRPGTNAHAQVETLFSW